MKRSSRNSKKDPNYSELHSFSHYQLQALLISLPQPMQWNVLFRVWVSN